VPLTLIDGLMAKYLVHFLNHGNSVWRVEHFIALNDKAATEHTSQVYRSSVGKGYEIWEGDRLVHTEVYRLARRSQR
jgi:hypothetical protein